MNNTPDSLAAQAREASNMMREMVQTYPQISENEPGGYCTEADQRMDITADILDRCADALERQAVPSQQAMSAALSRIVDRLQMDVDDGSRPDQWTMEDLIRLAKAALASSPPAPAQPEPAPGYCKHCKQYTIEEPLPAAPSAPAQSEVAEPVAWSNHDGGVISDWLAKKRPEYKHDYPIPLYATPPQPSPVADDDPDALTVAYLHGFSEGKRAALASQPTAKGEPLTDEQIERIAKTIPLEGCDQQKMCWGIGYSKESDFLEPNVPRVAFFFARAIEAAHHIGRKA